MSSNINLLINVLHYGSNCIIWMIVIVFTDFSIQVLKYLSLWIFKNLFKIIQALLIENFKEMEIEYKRCTEQKGILDVYPDRSVFEINDSDLNSSDSDDND